MAARLDHPLIVECEDPSSHADSIERGRECLALRNRDSITMRRHGHAAPLVVVDAMHFIRPHVAGGEMVAIDARSIAAVVAA
jgi:hypothetical protein